MAKEKYAGITKRLGARYGRGVKDRLAAIEMVRKAKKKCPYCHAIRIDRISRGIWLCTKCHAKFTGRAYTISAQIITAALPEEIQAEIAEKE